MYEIIRRKEINRSITAGVMRVFWLHMKRYPYRMYIVLFSTIALGILQVITPLFYKFFFDTLSKSKEIPQTVALNALIGAVLLITQFKGANWALRRIKGSASVLFQTKIMADLNDTAYKNLLEHSYHFFTNNFAGSLVRKVNKLARSFEDIADQVEVSLIPLLVTLTGIIIVLWRRSPLLSGVLFAGVMIFFTLNIVIARWKQKYDIEKSEKDSIATGVLADGLTNAVTIKTFSHYRKEEERYAGAIDDLRKKRIFTWGLNEGVDAAQGAIMVLLEFSMLYSAVHLWQRGFLTIGDFALIQIYLLQIFDRLWDFGRVLRRIYEGIADASEMVEILEAPIEVKDLPRASTLKIIKGEIEFRKVDFSFHQTRKILNSFSLLIRPGEKVAFVGSSGAGKTTVTKLLLRFYDIGAGEILIDGQNIARVTQASLRSQIAAVPQEPILFHRTLKENILYGRPDATEKEVLEAAHLAHCHEFISKLPEGYNTYVGERGVKLSGGERQRIAIARAILKNAKILMLDEATSSLDSESEALIQSALRRLMQGRTAIVIAHRLSTVMQMDKIVVIDKGKVTHIGTHKELLTSPGLYKNLWEIQAGGFTE